MRSNQLALFLIGTGVMFNVASAAGLTTLNHPGDSLAAQPYYASVGYPDPQTMQQAVSSAAQTMVLPKPPQTSMSNIFPVTSDLTPGDVDAQHLELQGLHYPLFVIGDDERSFKWVIAHQQFLKNIHAIGIVTNIDNEAAYHKLQQQIGLPLIPASLEGLEHIIPVQHYPFLINNYELSQ